MPSFTVRIGLLLVVLGTASYIVTGGTSLTAFIPSVVGAVLAVCGLIALRNPTARPHAMHAAALVALLGTLATAAALLQVPALLSGTAPRRPALVARIAMATILLVYLGFSVRSFVEARVRRKAQ